MQLYAQSFQWPLPSNQNRNCQKLVDILRLIQSTYNQQQTSEQKMSIAFNPAFSNMIRTVSSESLYKKILSYAEQKYSTKNLGLESLNPEQVVRIVYRNSERSFAGKASHQSINNQNNQTVWALNQFKVFAWISVCYAYTKNKQLQEFMQQDYEFLQSIFSKKSVQFIQYHLKSFEKDYNNYRAEWGQQQADLLNKIIKQQRTEEKDLVWSQISFRLFVESQKLYYRTPQKCRQKWYNHLSPQVNRNKWTLEEDIFLFKCISRHGLKWALISKQFQGSRTEHMTKNRYNSLINKYHGKSQKLSAKKAIEKVQVELYEKLGKITKVDSEQEKEPSQIAQEQKCCQDGEVQDRDKKDVTTVSAEQAANRNKLSSLNLDEVLFNETMIELQQPVSVNSKVELVEVQIYEGQMREDEYLSSLIF